MNNEPVAWIIQDKYGRPALSWKGNPISYSAISVEQEDIPLYTHPANTQDEGYEVVFDGEKYTTKLKEPAKTLTDEEIVEIFQRLFNVNKSWETLVFEFARAILRKANEK